MSIIGKFVTVMVRGKSLFVIGDINRTWYSALTDEGTVICTSRESNDILTAIILQPSRYHHVLYSLSVSRNSCTRFRDQQLDVHFE